MINFLFSLIKICPSFLAKAHFNRNVKTPKLFCNLTLLHSFMQFFIKLTSQGLLCRVGFAFLLVFTSVSLKAQTEITPAKSYLTDNAEKLKVDKTDISQMSVSSAYLSPTTGWYHVYFNQTHQDIEVFNAVMNVTLKNGLVVNTNHTFVENLTTLAANINTNNVQSTISPTQAIERATQHLNLTSGTISKIREASSSRMSSVIEKGKYSSKSLSNENIDVKLYWLPIESGEPQPMA